MAAGKVRPAAPGGGQRRPRIQATHSNANDSGEEAHKQQLGQAAAEFASSVTLRAQIIRLCRRPRLVVELLAEVAAEHRIGASIGAKLARYDALDFETLRAVGGDVVPLAPLHTVRP